MTGTDGRAPTVDTIVNRPDLRVSLTTLRPGEEIPWHRHGEVADTFYGVRGRLTILTRDPAARSTLDPGRIVRVERGRPHRVVNDTAEPAEYLLIQGMGTYDFHPDPGG